MLQLLFYVRKKAIHSMNGRNWNCELFNAFEKGMTACTCLKKNTTFDNTTSLQVPSYNNDRTTQK